MNLLIFFCSCFVIFISASGFLFGQLFFGDFEIGATIAGMSGLFGGAYAIIAGAKNKRTLLTIIFCILCLLGVFIDVYDYYSTENVAGNYYAWFLVGPYIFFLLIMIFSELFWFGYKTS